MLTNGDQAPDFELPDADMRLVRLSGYRGQRNVILYFYPKDGGSGCITEAVEFTDLKEAFERLDAEILGISRDDCVSHAAFRDEHGLQQRLLADTEGEVCERYAVCQTREKEGTGPVGITRSTFIIDRDGVIREAMYGVSAKGHAGEVLERLRALS